MNEQILQNLYQAYLGWTEEPMPFEEFESLNRANIEAIVGGLALDNDILRS